MKKEIISLFILLGILGGVSVANAVNYTQSADLESGSSHYFSISDASQTGLDFSSAITLEGWVKFESLPASNQVFASKRNSGGNQRAYSFFFDGSANQLKLMMSFNGLNGDCCSSSISWTPSTGIWYHVAMTWSQASDLLTMYVDGASVGTYDTTPDMGANNIFDSSAAFYIGAEEPTATNFLDGQMFGWRAWNTERTGTQVNNNKCSILGSSSGLKGEWIFNGDATDNSGTGNNLTNNNATPFVVNVPNCFGSSFNPLRFGDF